MVALTLRTWHGLMLLAQLFSIVVYILSLLVLKDYFGEGGEEGKGRKGREGKGREGTGRDGTGRKGKERKGMEWNGMEWNGMEWKGKERKGKEGGEIGIKGGGNKRTNK